MKNKFPIWMKAFALNLLIASIAIIPFIIRGDGYFALAYDYSGQGIPFQMFMNSSVKSGHILWNSGIDLGSNFLESFNYYNLGSVFTLLLLIIPTRFVPYMMGPVLILKFAVAGMSSALYLKRHIKKDSVLLMCTSLYAFSGFSCTSLLFFQYMDMVALFPFLIFAIELMIEEKKVGWLAFFTAVNCACNFSFFVGELLFLTIYVTVRYGKIKSILKSILPEILIGIAVTGVITIPAINGLLAKNNHIEAMNAYGFFDMQTTSFMQFFKSLFFPQEYMNASASVWNVDWMTDSLYIPLFGAAFWLAYVWKKKRDWLSKMIQISLVIAVIPGLNCLLTMGSYLAYHRWYYMLVLMLITATGKVLTAVEDYPVSKAILCQTAVITVLTLIIFVVDWDGQGTGLLYNERLFGIQLVLLAVGTVLSILYVWKKKYRGLFLFALTVFCIGNLGRTVFQYRNCVDNTGIHFTKFEEQGVAQSEAVINYLTEIAAQMNPNVGPYRYYFGEGLTHTYYNIGMTNSLPTINSAISYLSPGIFEFYETSGIGRWDFTLSGPKGTASFLGARYIVNRCGENEEADYRNSNGQGFSIYENEDALPIGFAYDSYILESELEQLDSEERIAVMIAALCIPDEYEQSVSQTIAHASTDELIQDKLLVANALQNRKGMTCSDFSYSKKNNRFSAIMDVPESETGRYVLFTIPYDKHWKATVNGVKVPITDAAGFMAIKAEPGMNTIVVTYWYTPLFYGAVVSMVGMFGIIWILTRRTKKNEKNTTLAEGISC